MFPGSGHAWASVVKKLIRASRSAEEVFIVDKYVDVNIIGE